MLEPRLCLPDDLLLSQAGTNSAEDPAVRAQNEDIKAVWLAKHLDTSVV